MFVDGMSREIAAKINKLIQFNGVSSSNKHNEHIVSIAIMGGIYI